jgi:hypothetical protein
MQAFARPRAISTAKFGLVPVNQITSLSVRWVFDTAGPKQAERPDMTMTANHKNRLLRIDGRHVDETPYDMVVVCLWFVFGVSLMALLFWLALGGEL